MKKIILFRNGNQWLDRTVTIEYRKLGLMALFVVPVAVVAATSCVLFSRMVKDLKNIDIINGWGDSEDVTENTVQDDL